MNKLNFLKRLMMIVIMGACVSNSFAGSPVWSFTPLTATSVSVSDMDVATVQYQVTNQSSKSHTLQMQSLGNGISQITTSGHCADTFTLLGKQSCILSLSITGSAIQGNKVGGPVVCEQNSTLQCYQPDKNNLLTITKTNVMPSTTLSTSVTSLGLSVAGLTEYGVNGTPASGRARTITLTNTGSYPASNLVITYPVWPAGTVASSTCGSTLNAGASCTISVTPGSVATSDGSNPCTTGTEPLPNNIVISSDASNTVNINVFILGYGCIYQNGYIFAFDDTTSTMTSVGGKVMAASDQSVGIFWSADSGGSYDGGVSIYGISQISTSISANPNMGFILGQNACEGATDGRCNTNNILVYYSPAVANFFYAAGVCRETISGYSDWYLPAMCELGYDGGSCGSVSTPMMQNIQSYLMDTLALLANDYYWSSTEFSSIPKDFVFAHYFSQLAGFSLDVSKNVLSRVRCVRVLT